MFIVGSCGMAPGAHGVDEERALSDTIEEARAGMQPETEHHRGGRGVALQGKSE
jgi:hypothetical protein